MNFPDPFIVAEIGANHNGDFRTALRLIDAAKGTGADAVKLQCYRPESMTIRHDGPEFRVQEGPWKGWHLYNLYQEATTPRNWFPKLFDHAKATGITCFSSVFDQNGVDFLEELDCPIYKIASFEITDLPLIEYAAATGKPMIISTGMASHQEISDAMNVAVPTAQSVTLLHCVSAYPTKPSEANLARIFPLGHTFGCPVGFSDHTLSTTLPAVAMARGASVIEKHLTLRRDDGGPDASFSLEPTEFRQMVDACREAHEALKAPEKPAEPHRDLRRSLYAVQDIKEGDMLTEENVRSIRASRGLAPRYLMDLLGTKAKHSFRAGEPITLEKVTG